MRGTVVELIRIDNAAQNFAPVHKQLEDAEAIIFGAPTYMGSISGVFKAFMDSTSKVWGGFGE